MERDRGSSINDVTLLGERLGIVTMCDEGEEGSESVKTLAF